MVEVTRHFVSSCFAVNEKREVLLLHHKKLKMWLPPGGHIDRDELPDDAAVRETKEETGIEVELVGNQETIGDGVLKLTSPQHVQLEDINKYHQHIDFVYFAKHTGGELVINKREANDVKWFSEQDLQSPDIREEVRRTALNAIEKVSRKFKA